MATFLLLLGFALVKVVIGLLLIYLGLHGGEREEPDDFGTTGPPDVPPQAPSRRRLGPHERPERGRPTRKASPLDPRRERV